MHFLTRIRIRASQMKGGSLPTADAARKAVAIVCTVLYSDSRVMVHSERVKVQNTSRIA